jgi:myo-inositol-1(or 4)-monophosphatase
MPYERELRVALEAARRAEVLILDHYARFEAIANPRMDISTAADRDAQEAILQHLRAAFPADALCAEESTAALEGVAQVGPRLWIVDPIDGTHNFLRGIPYWNVSIAYVEGGQRMLGAICDPVAGTVHHAMRGHGAWRSDASGEVRMATSATLEVPGAIVCVGHHDRKPEPRYLALRAALMEINASFRNFGCAALQIAHVAEGRYDAYIELDLSSWDAMAGLLLVEEAGGYVGPFPGPQGLTVRAPVIVAAPGIAGTLRMLVRASTGIA